MQFKEGDEVAWIVKYIKRDTTHAADHNGISIQLEISPGNSQLVHNPRLYLASALEVNEKLLLAAKQAGSVLALHAGNLETSIRANLNAAIAAADQAKGG